MARLLVNGVLLVLLAAVPILAFVRSFRGADHAVRDVDASRNPP